ncbi:MAG: CBS domain-containing protein [Syntrophomonadaceae bacterium]
MEIITSHNALDFDGLASMVAAGKLYPGAVKVFSGTLSKNVKQFLALYKDSLLIKQAKDIDIKRVDRLIIVDTANANRLGQLKNLAFQPDTDIHIYDHHPSTPEDLQGSINEVHLTGAATTILVEKIIAANINISPFDATILALGIYEDTGSLLFSSTTYRDVNAVGYLLQRGANLSLVANFMEEPFSNEQRQILQRLLQSARHFEVNNATVLIADSETDEFVPGLDVVTFRLFEMENCDAVFVVALMQGKINVVARSRTGNIKVNEVLKSLGGRGHEKAASAVVKGKSCDEVSQLIRDSLTEIVSPGATARDIMSTPVRTISPHITMEEAGGIMLRYGYTGMPVVEGDEMVGVISRRDVDKARIHELGHAPVKGFMTSQVLSIKPDTPLDDIQKLMVEFDIGRLPVVDEGRLVGIVSRTDILRILHGEDYPEDHAVLYTMSDGETANCRDLMRERLPSRILSLLQVAGEVASNRGSKVYCVGGFVRDLFLQVPNYDVDLVVEGDGAELAHDLASRLGGSERVHERFRTAVVKLGDGTKLDIATARTEYYEFPAALPRVERSSIKEDMYRRDFTINTLAICLNPDRFGELIDYFGGRHDLQKGLIRILYNLSFVEDPTRILRAIRFEQRYRFTIEPDTLRLARDAIERRMLGKLSYKRILQELVLILSEKDPVPALKRMKEIGVWYYILPEVNLEELSEATLKRISIIMVWWQERYCRPDVRSWVVYLMYILSSLTEVEVEEILTRYSLDSHAKRCIRESLQIEKLAAQITESPDLLPGDIDKLVGTFTDETLIYLLLRLKDEQAWERVVKYLDLKETVSVDTNGFDLMQLGLKQGPYFKVILDKLYELKLNQEIHSQAEEIEVVKKWIAEGRFLDAIV